MLHTLEPTAAMLKLSGQSDPDLQRYLRDTHTHTYTQRDRQTEILFFYRELLQRCFALNLQKFLGRHTTFHKYKDEYISIFE